jgi:hypothetical protein
MKKVSYTRYYYGADDTDEIIEAEAQRANESLSATTRKIIREWEANRIKVAHYEAMLQEAHNDSRN